MAVPLNTHASIVQVYIYLTMFTTKAAHFFGFVYPVHLLSPTVFLIIVQAALVAINTALDEGNADSTLEALQNEHLDLSDVSPDNKEYYFQGLQAKKQEKAAVHLLMDVCLYTYMYIYIHVDV